MRIVERLGYIGLGIMGRGMVSNLIAAGHSPTVWNRTRSKADGLGARVVDNPQDVGPESDIVFICVSDTPDVEEVVFGDYGVIHGMTEGDVLVDHSTISPVATAQFAAQAAELSSKAAPMPALITREYISLLRGLSVSVIAADRGRRAFATGR